MLHFIEKLVDSTETIELSSKRIEASLSGLGLSDYTSLADKAKNFLCSSNAALSDLPTISKTFDFYLHKDENNNWQIYDIDD